MVDKRKWFLSPIVLFTAGLIATMWLNGCGNAPQGPLAPENAEVQSQQDAPAPSDVQQPRSTKLLGGVLEDVLTLNVDDALGSTVSTVDALVLNPNSRVEFDKDIFDFWHAEDLWVTFGRYADYHAGEIQVLEARFDVDRYSVPYSSGKVEISMEVHSGATLDDIYVKFEPHGFNFIENRPATLQLKLRGKNVPEVADGYHTYDAEVEKIDVTYKENNGLLEKYVTLTMKVPGFSRYSLGGNKDR